MYEIIFYEKENGSIPVDDYIFSLSDKQISKIRGYIKLLQEQGRNLKYPYCSYLQAGVWELRIKFSSNIFRITYFIFTDNKIILLSGFTKKNQKTPVDEIEKAVEYKLDYERRNQK
jgi:phage-related protein